MYCCDKDEKPLAGQKAHSVLRSVYYVLATVVAIVWKDPKRKPWTDFGLVFIDV